MEDNQLIPGFSLVPPISNDLYKIYEEIDKKYKTINGQTALYWGLVGYIAEHIKESE